MSIKHLIAVLALVAVLGVVNGSILKKERHLDNGRVVILELAPVDPRSLMQGDYMALRFAVARDLRNALPKKDDGHRWWSKVDADDGWAVLNVDERGVGQFSSVAQTSESSSGQINLAFRVRSGTVKFATNAFFFEEGTAKRYERARYGEFRVNEKGEPLLVALLDENLVNVEQGESVSR